MKRSSVPVYGVRLAYREAGSGDPLLLVHGNFASGRWFEEQLDSPPVGYRLIAPDLPNFGESDGMPEEISIASYARYLAGFCDALAIERLTLLGHSLGGAVAQAFATEQPDRIERLILVASAAPDGHETPAEHFPVLESLKGNREGLALALAATMPSRRPSWFEGVVDDALALAPHAITGNVRALAEFDVSEEARSYPGPVLVLRGDLDLPHLITEEIARRTAAAYPNSRLELWQGVGHSPQVEAPQRFNRLLAEFLAEVVDD
ncbi:MAG TPA: alpha/beta hydrolase [Trueperaceae bacterium]